MKNSYGTVYKVFIEFDENEVETDAVQSFVDDNFSEEMSEEEVGVKIINLIGHKLELLWKVPAREGVHEIENELFYILEDGKLGTYSWECVE